MHQNLPPRQLEILKLVAIGEPYKGIADKLGISLHTVARHAELLYKNLGINHHVQAVHYALHHGLVENLYKKK